MKGWLVLIAIVWPSIIQLKADYNVEDGDLMLICGVTTTAITLLIGNIFFLILYKGKFAFFEKYKALEDPWPWESDPLEWNKLRQRSIKFSLFNLFVVAPAMNYPVTKFAIRIQNKMDFNYPSEVQLLASILFCCLMEDLCFYFSHSTLHKPFFYSRIHKYHHEHKVPTTFACIHAHPIEFYFGNVVP